MNPESIAVSQDDGRANRRVGGSERDAPPRPSSSLELEAFVGPETVREFLAFDSVETIYRLCRSGMPHRRIGRNLRFRLSEIEEWLAGSTGANGDSDDSETFAEDQPVRRPWLT